MAKRGVWPHLDLLWHSGVARFRSSQKMKRVAFEIAGEQRLAQIAGHMRDQLDLGDGTGRAVSSQTAAASPPSPASVLDAMGNVWEAVGGALPALKVTPNSSGLSTTSQPEVTLQLPAGTGAIIAMAVDVAGFVWVTDGVSLHRADPRDEGSMIRVRRGLPTGTISSLRQHPSGYAAATVDGVEFTVTNDLAKPAPTSLPASAWREVARLPCGNHDIAAAVLGSSMYISGGLAPGGFPNQYRVFDEVWSCKFAST